MKKILLIFMFLLIMPSFAKDYTQYCSNYTPQKTLTGNIVSMTGLNTITRKIVENEIKSEFKKQAKAKLDVKIDSFYGTNILNGEFKNISGNAQNLEYQGFYLSDFEFSSMCQYNKIALEDNNLKFEENFVADFKAQINQDDLNNYVLSTNFQKTIDKLNKDEKLSSLFKVESGKIQLLEDKLMFKYKIIPFPNSNNNFIKSFLRPVNISFGSNIRINEGKVELCDFDFNNIKISYNYLLPLLNLSNPTEFEFKISNNNAKMEVQNIKIENSKIIMNGVLLVLK